MSTTVQFNSSKIVLLHWFDASSDAWIPVSALNPLPTTGGGGGGTVVGASADNSPNTATKLPTLSARANASSPAWTEGNQVPLSVDLTGALRVSGASGGGIAQLQVRSGANSWTDIGYAGGDLNVPVQGTITANAGTGNFTVVQPTGTNLHVVPDTSNVVVQGSVTISGYADVIPVTQSITNFDVNSISHVLNKNQIAYTGTPTSGSVASFTLSSFTAIKIQVSGSWTGTMLTEISVDNGIKWYPVKVSLFGNQDILFDNFTQNFLGSLNVSGLTNFRIRTTDIDFAGTATILVLETRNESDGTKLLGTSPVSITNFPKIQGVQDITANDLLWMILDELRSMNEENGIFSNTNE